MQCARSARARSAADDCADCALRGPTLVVRATRRTALARLERRPHTTHQDLNLVPLSEKRGMATLFETMTHLVRQRELDFPGHVGPPLFELELHDGRGAVRVEQLLEHVWAGVRRGGGERGWRDWRRRWQRTRGSPIGTVALPMPTGGTTEPFESFTSI